MSYTPNEARWEFMSMMDEALHTRDTEKAITIRDYYAEVGDFEEADRWNELAKRWEREDWSYDESKGN